MQDWIKNIPIEWITQLMWGVIAICGGTARYLNGFANGAPFNFGIFLASAFVAGFSGWMFALLGASMNFSEQFIFMMAGTGGFMGEQTMKFIIEQIQRRLK